MQEAKSPSPLRTGGTDFVVNTLGTTNPLLGQNGPQLHLPLNVSGEVLCARYPRLRAIWKGYKNPPPIGYPRLGMGEPWVTEKGYIEVCHFLCTTFLLRQAMTGGNLQA